MSPSLMSGLLCFFLVAVCGIDLVLCGIKREAYVYPIGPVAEIVVSPKKIPNKPWAAMATIDEAHNETG